MTLELRITSGARAGVRERFEKSVVAIGRHPLSDLRFDPQQDLDVSTRHAELRAVEGVWTLYDQQSTNGTFVNGERVEGSRRIRDGDRISFGANGPMVEVRTSARAAHLEPSSAEPSPPSAPSLPIGAPLPRTDPEGPVVDGRAKPRRDTTARIADAVEAQTAPLRRALIAAVAALVLLGAGGAWWWQREAAARDRELMALIARSDSVSAAFERTVAAMRTRDPELARQLAERAAASRRALREGGGGTAAGGVSRRGVEQLSQRVSADTRVQQSLAQMDLPGVHDRNDAAVAMVASDLDGTYIAGTAFGVSRAGLLVTNRHVVRTDAGQAPRRIRVIYANTTDWLPAHLVRTDDGDDLALIQIDAPGSYPVVAGVSRQGAMARVGAPVLSIGYPHAVDTPMKGSGLQVTAATTTTAGTVSKRLDDVLQIDSYAGKGSSGSPVFDAQANVVGVIYGGAPESNGRIVYAVPAGRLAAFLGAEGAGILRD